MRFEICLEIVDWKLETMTRKLLKILLKACAVKILNKYHPEIIGITGSVGKSSTREAVYAVLSSHWRIRQSVGNFNTEIGVPLTIIGSASGDRSILGWLRVFCRALGLILFQDKNYPEILVLEMAADRPGDIEYLAELTKPKIGIVTTVGISHLEYFNTIERIAIEKSKLARALRADGFVVLNFDDTKVRDMRSRTKAKVITYGFDEAADVRALEVSLESKLEERKDGVADFGGTLTKIKYQGNVLPLYLPNVLGKTHVYAALAATALGLIKGLNLIEIVEALRCYNPPAGRLKILPGIKKTYLIDDTYNSAPTSLEAALELLASLKISENAKRFAVLGDMLELGNESEAEHYRFGKIIAKKGIDTLIAVGSRAKDFGRGAKDGGMNEEAIFHFGNNREAGVFAQARIKSGDLILIKASRSLHFEEITRELMAEPLRAGELLAH